MSEDLSPMQRVYWNFDLDHPNFTEKQYQQQAQIEFSQGKTQNALLIEELKWRKEHGMNFIASAEGWGGSGKSRGMSYLGWLIGNIMGVPFTPKHIVWLNKELDDALSNSKVGETFLKDEHQHKTTGRRSMEIQLSLADYENQLRQRKNNLLYASIKLQEHNHFFVFEFLYPIWCKTPEEKPKSWSEEDKKNKAYPKSFVAMIKTPKYGQRYSFVCRGFCIFPMPSEEFDKEYEARKEEHLDKLKAKYGNNLDFIPVDTKEMIETHSDLFIKTLSNGTIVPKSNPSIEQVICDLKYSYDMGTMKIVISTVKDLIEEKYAEHNSKISQLLFEQKKKESEEKRKILESQQKAAEERHRQKMELKKQELEELKRKNDIKQKSIELRQQNIVEKEKLPEG